MPAPTPTPTSSVTPTLTMTPTPTFTPIVSGLPDQKLFVLRGQPSTDVLIEQFSTTKPNILTTLVSDGITFDISNEAKRPQGMFVPVAGDQVFVLDGNVNNGTGLVYKYSVGTGWDLSTIAYTGASFSVNAHPSDVNAQFRPVDLKLDSSGDTLYILDDVSDTIFQYDIATSYQLNTITYSGTSLSVNRNPTRKYSPISIFWGNLGNKLYVVDEYSLSVDQYVVSTLYDIGTAVYEKTFHFPGNEIFGVSFSADGTRLYVDTGNLFRSYALASEWEVDTGTLIEANDTGISGVNKGLEFRAADIGEVTATPTPTVTVTPTITPTLTVTPTLSPTTTPTVTVSPTVSATVTPTLTASVTPSVTVTPTNTPTVTVTPTNTPTVTVTVTVSPTVTPTITPTVTVSPTVSPTVTPTVTVTPSPTS